MIGFGYCIVIHIKHVIANCILLLFYPTLHISIIPRFQKHQLREEFTFADAIFNKSNPCQLNMQLFSTMVS
jgi:hypothetical protein